MATESALRDPTTMWYDRNVISARVALTGLRDYANFCSQNNPTGCLYSNSSSKCCRPTRGGSYVDIRGMVCGWMHPVPMMFAFYVDQPLMMVFSHRNRLGTCLFCR